MNIYFTHEVSSVLWEINFKSGLSGRYTPGHRALAGGIKIWGTGGGEGSQ